MCNKLLQFPGTLGGGGVGRTPTRRRAGHLERVELVLSRRLRIQREYFYLKQQITIALDTV